MQKIISGIQQVGIGVPDLEKSWAWYRKWFGMDIPVLNDIAEADLMTNYTGNKVQCRHACLAININGGGGFEIWQFTSREPQPAKFEVILGNYGIFITKMKTSSVKKSFANFKKEDINLLSEVITDPAGNKKFYLKDPLGNIFQMIESNIWLTNGTSDRSGGVAGVVLGVSDMDKSLKLYTGVLGFDEIIFDEHGVFDDFSSLPGGQQKVRRILLKHTKPMAGPFSRLLGPASIELVQALEGKHHSIYIDRMWGDQGFIHLCFDIKNMDALKEECKQAGFSFTVDSQDSYDMGDSAGRFSYIEDPDGTLIEFVETDRVPIFKKIGWYLDISKRDPSKSLPDWLVRAMRFGRKND